MIRQEVMRVTMTRGTTFGPHVRLEGAGPFVYADVSRKRWATTKLGDLATVWFLFDQPVWVHWHRPTDTSQEGA